VGSKDVALKSSFHQFTDIPEDWHEGCLV
jgi:hypothetical protein